MNIEWKHKWEYMKVENADLDDLIATPEEDIIPTYGGMCWRAVRRMAIAIGKGDIPPLRAKLILDAVGDIGLSYMQAEQSYSVYKMLREKRDGLVRRSEEETC